MTTKELKATIPNIKSDRNQEPIKLVLAINLNQNSRSGHSKVNQPA